MSRATVIRAFLLTHVHVVRWIIIIVVITLTILIIVFDDKIIDALEPTGKKIKACVYSVHERNARTSR